METPKAAATDVWVIAQEQDSGRIMYAPNLMKWLDQLTAPEAGTVLGTWTIHFTTIPGYVHPDKFTRLIQESCDIPIQYTLVEDFRKIAEDFGYRNLK